MARLANDLDLYEREAAGWWQADNRFFRSLRSVKEFHLAFLLEHWRQAPAGRTVVDLGCGGGLLSIPLSQRGARVIGVDLSGASLRAGAVESAHRGLETHFVRADLTRTPLESNCADLVLLSDVIEHVPDPGLAVSEAGRILRPGGLFFVNTFDRRRGAGFVVVTLAEGVGLVPRGTHDARLFVRPEELKQMAQRAGLRETLLQWEAPALWKTMSTWTIHMKRTSHGFAYTSLFTKDAESPTPR